MLSRLGHADALAEIPDRLRGIPAPAQTGKRRHSRIIPSADQTFLHQLQEFSFAHHRIGQIQPGEFDLLGMIDPQLIEKPVVERADGLQIPGCRWNG